MRKLLVIAIAIGAIAQSRPARSQEPEATVQPVRFAGTWVGTQAWAIENPPPGSRQDQPVTLEIEVDTAEVVRCGPAETDGKHRGSSFLVGACRPDNGRGAFRVGVCLARWGVGGTHSRRNGAQQCRS